MSFSAFLAKRFRLSHPSGARAFLFSLLLVLTLIPLPARAQEEAPLLTLFPPETSAYPTITFLLDAFTPQGDYLKNLNPAQVNLLEDGKGITPDQVETLQPVLHLAVAINAGPALATRDGFGLSRYDKLTAVLDNWAQARPSQEQDSLTLAWNGGIVASRLPPLNWRPRLQTFDPGLRAATPSLGALAYALDDALAASAPPGGKKAILLISPHLENRDLANLPELLTRAQQAQVRIFVWMTDSDAYLTHPGALALQDLAQQTGGSYAAFTGSETLPDPETWFSPLRFIYRVTYQSGIRTEGTHSLAVQVGASTSQTENFLLNVLPPSAALLAPPSSLIRQNEETPFDYDTFLPAEQSISALLEFKDGFPRPLRRTALLVDGVMVDENTSAPFDQFTWDLRDYQVSATHTLLLEVTDNLGMSSQSQPIPVQVTVIQPPGGVWGLIRKNAYALTLFLIVLAGLALTVILFFGGKRTFTALAERRRARALQQDPVTQPVDASPAPAASPFPWLRRKTPPPLAYLVKLSPEGLPTPGDPIPLTGAEMTFGTDPTQATNVLDHPSLAPLQARLRYEQNAFTLADQNSVSGCWLNYERLPKEGRALKHGDMIHFGELTYRFVLAKPPSPKKPTLTPL